MISALKELKRPYGTVQTCSKLCNTAFEHTLSAIKYVCEELECYFLIADASSTYRHHRTSAFRTPICWPLISSPPFPTARSTRRSCKGAPELRRSSRQRYPSSNYQTA